MISIRKATLQNEISIKRFLIKHEPQFMNSWLIRDYYFSGSNETGIVMILENETIIGLAFFSIMLEKNKSYIHMWFGPIEQLDNVKALIGYPCQVFLKSGITPSDKWSKQLEVFPGMTVDHPAYNGVFSRSIPKFDGAVYECS